MCKEKDVTLEETSNPEHQKVFDEAASEVRCFIQEKESAPYGGMVEEINFWNDYFGFHYGYDRHDSHREYLRMKSNNRTTNSSFVHECYRAEITKRLEEKYNVSLEGLKLENPKQFAEAIVQKLFDK